MNINNQKYYIGLDMGTSSVGWAVTDDRYNLLRVKGKDLWGVRLFNEAKTAQERRANRTSRRNHARHKARVGLLRGFFEEEINKIDPGFFERLEESKYYLEDRNNKTPFTLFADNGYTDKEYYDKYPTVFHLIMDLINNKDVHDVRLVYIACLNIFKHRGNFLNEKLDGDGIESISDLVDSLKNNISVYNDSCQDEEAKIVINDFEKLEKSLQNILVSRKMSGSSKQREIETDIDVNSKQKNVKELLKMICGNKGKMSVLFPKEEYSDEQKKLAISFNQSDFDEKMAEVNEMLSNEEIELFYDLKKIHDWGVLSCVMGEYKYLSEARIASFEKHESDLKLLKEVYKQIDKESNSKKYYHMFRTMEDNNYSAYVGKVSSNKASQTPDKKTRLQRRGAKATQEEFYKRIKNDLKNNDSEDIKHVLADIDNATFLPKQLTNANGAIPYQLHSKELKAILKNASQYLDFLNVTDEKGMSVTDKIIKLFEFRIPYYVGPLYNCETNNAWSVRKVGGEGRVYPWNFSEKIDEKASAEKFIENMVRHCTYIQNETVLPKESLKYERFRVLNEINNIRINGERISAEIKQDLYNNLLKKSKRRITKNKIKEYILANRTDVDSDIEISGIDDVLANSLSSYRKFTEIFGVETLSDEQEKAAENIILWSTVYNDSKKFLKEKINESYGMDSDNPMLSKEQINRVCGMKFKDWGKLSKNLLEIEASDRMGVILPLLTRMWEESYNFMELLSGNFFYKEEIEALSNGIEKELSEITYEDIDELYISPAVKRMTWQTVQILKELCDVIGYAPSKVFVEMARDSSSKDKGKRTVSRKAKLVELYKACKGEKELLNSLNARKDDELKSKKLYLYYVQMGKCMYSGESIHLERLLTDDYDIDHIYPQSLVKEDSLDNNMVLVKREYNNKKSNNYPLFLEWQNNMKSYWDMLREKNFINDQKYNRLVRREALTDNELADFVNRQIVETRQGTKAVAELLIKTFGDSTRVVYAKAGNVSDFRHKFSRYDFKKIGKNEDNPVINPEFVKCRAVNDFHHAKDAYLNIVVGNAYDVKFTQNPYNYIKELKKQQSNTENTNGINEKYHMDKIFQFDIIRGEEVGWLRTGNKEDKSLFIVSNTLKKNTPMVTRMNYEEKGQLADLTIYSADEAKSKKGVGYIQVKSTDEKLSVGKYGGFKKFKGAYFYLVEHTKKDARIRTIEAVPLYLKQRLTDKKALEEYSKNVLGLINPDVRLTRIKMYSLIKIDGFYAYLTGRSNSSLLISNAVQLVLDDKWNDYIRVLSKDGDDLAGKADIEKNNSLFNIFVKKYSEEIYSKRPNAIGDKLKQSVDIYTKLDIEDQVNLILNLTRLSGIGNDGIDLEKINGAKIAGKMKVGKQISDKNEVKLINKSITGIYENVIDLLTV